MTVTTHVDSLDRTVHVTNAWLAELSEATGLDDRREVYLVLRATLHALRDRLPQAEAVQLAAQFPALVRGFYYEGWSPASKPAKVRTREDFLALVRAHMQRDDFEDLEGRVRAVFSFLSSKITAGEIDDVTHALPAELRELWQGARS